MFTHSPLKSNIIELGIFWEFVAGKSACSTHLNNFPSALLISNHSGGSRIRLSLPMPPPMPPQAHFDGQKATKIQPVHLPLLQNLPHFVHIRRIAPSTLPRELLLQLQLLQHLLIPVSRCKKSRSEHLGTDKRIE
jgi:hypothetical protein